MVLVAVVADEWCRPHGGAGDLLLVDWFGQATDAALDRGDSDPFGVIVQDTRAHGADVCSHDHAGEECWVDSGLEADAGETVDQERLQGVVKVVRLLAE